MNNQNDKFKKITSIIIGIFLITIIIINTYLVIVSFNYFILATEIISLLGLIVIILEIIHNKIFKMSKGEKKPLETTNHNELDSLDTINTSSDNGEFLEIPKDIVEIPNSYHMNDLIVKEILMPDTVTKIGNSAFKYCSYLTSITVSNNLTHIGLSAFSNCHSLKCIYIPKTVTYIGNWAFDKCPNLVIYCEAESKGSDWAEHWNSSNCPIIWGISLEDYKLTNKE